jgi:hypothetical protein
MTYDEVIATLQGRIGRSIAVNVTETTLGRGSGYVADFAGNLTRVDEPVAGVDEPVFYFRVDDDGGFAVHKNMFEGASWETIAGQRWLIVRLAHVELGLDLTD